LEKPAHVIASYLQTLGYKVEKQGTGEIYRIGSSIVWFDYSRERPDKPGTFFHGTARRIFEDLYQQYPKSFFMAFLLGYPETTIGVVISGAQFNEIFKNKEPDTRGQWKYQLRQVGNDYFLKTWGAGDFNVSEGLHDYELLGLTHEQSVLVQQKLSSVHADYSTSSDDPEVIVDRFREWLSSSTAQAHLSTIANEKHDVTDLMKKLRSLNKESAEFDDLVLYGLLPNSKTKYAKRVSTFAVFQNVKSFFKEYDYNDADWHKIALSIFRLADEFAQSPESIKLAIEEFTKNKQYSRGFQCGSLTPILFCINDSFPVVNNRVIHTYNDFATFLGWNDNLHQKVDYYLDNVNKCRRLIAELAVSELKDLAVFDLFCYWYDLYYKTGQIEQAPEFEEDAADRTGIKKIEFVAFLKSLNLENATKFDPRSLKNPERIKIRDVVANCSKGDWVLPKFQRYFEWRKNDIRDFLASIFNDYYVGSLLLWDVSKDPPLDFMVINGVDLRKEEANPDSLILDGQQRVTSIYYAINAPKFSLRGAGKPVYFYINFQNFFDRARSDEIPELEPAEIITVLPAQLERNETFSRLLFPVYELASYTQWVDRLEDFLIEQCKTRTGEVQLSEPIRKLKRVIDSRLRHIWDGFEIPYVSLPESMELYQVTDIFEKINTAGIRLSVFDLLIARLSKYDIELRKLWEDATKRYSKLSDYNDSIERMPVYVLQAASLCYNKASACKREDLLDIYRKVFQNTELEFSDVWYEMADYVNRAIEKMELLRSDSGFGVKDRDSLPFEPMIPILAALLRIIESKSNKMQCYDKLKVWYWSSVFSNAYSGAVDTQLTADFKNMLEWFEDDSRTPNTVEIARRDFVTIDLRKVKSKSSALYQGVLSLIALQGARDFDTGQSLENARQNDEDHLFPRGHFKGSEFVNSVLNMTWMSEETNRVIKHGMTPSEYLKHFMKKSNEKEFARLLETHFINAVALEYMRQDQFEKFIEERQKAILSKIGELIGFKDPFAGSTEITSGHVFRNEMAFWNTLKQCDGYIHWVDKYFSAVGLRFLYYSMNKDTVSDVKILLSSEKANENLRHYFGTFRDELKSEGVDCQMRVIVDREIKTEIHDRYVISRNVTFNVPSVDTAEIGQFSEIKKSTISLPFDRWWSNSLDIFSQWNEIRNSQQAK
jgi:hypothetical protein